MDDHKNKGGRIAKTASDYFGVSSNRDAYFRELKRRFGSAGVDIYLLILQLIAQSPFFLYPLNSVNLRRIQEEDMINPEEFEAVVNYCVDELHILDSVLYKNGYLFSVNFVRTFEKAGLFRHRKYTEVHVLKAANHFRPGYPPLTIEDTLELIAQGMAPDFVEPPKDAPKSSTDNDCPPKKPDGNEELGHNNRPDGNELPF